jgi:hypothetical protein
LEFERCAGQAAGEQSALGKTDPCYAGQCGETSLELAIERIHSGRLVTDQRGIDAEQKDVVGIETRVYGAKILQRAD